MTSLKTLIGIAAVLFVVFFINVLLGAFAGANFLQDAGEALLLFAACIVFVAAMLAAETQAKS